MRRHPVIDYVCDGCGCTEQFTCNCWEKNGAGAAKYSPRQIAGRIHLEELRDKQHGKQRGSK
jgi:hypothetical protein